MAKRPRSGAVSEGRVDREQLSRLVMEDREALADLEAIVHPLVQAGERTFVADALRRGADCAVIEIPLLYETGADARNR